MAVYAVSDIHGQYEKFMDILEQIDLKETDTLYVLGDVIDRGPEPMKVFFEMMKHENIIPLIGNHELMGVGCMKRLHEGKLHYDGFPAMHEDLSLFEWLHNGADPTIETFMALSEDDRERILSYMYEFRPFEEINVGGRDFVLVHAGLGGFSPDKELPDYSLMELVWERPDFAGKYYDDRTVILGHTPTQYLHMFMKPGSDLTVVPGRIFHGRNLVNIDCGAGRGDNLAAIRLDDMKEYYSRA